MIDTCETAIVFLRQSGKIITEARRKIIKILFDDLKPHTPSEILTMLLKKGLHVDKTTVYRELEFLIKMEVVREVIFLDGLARYEINSVNCHHHVTCSICGRVEDVKIEEKKLIESIEKQSNFTVDRHSIEFSGLCASCS